MKSEDTNLEIIAKSLESIAKSLKTSNENIVEIEKRFTRIFSSIDSRLEDISRK
ncbi:hypothetical protein PT250_02590 [Erysipelothrix rhusiopathiae]|uniref:hypothetical protein n=1 Tax=Erysipelothrix rhusiopathiae TaxID=1648 RepID=UPI0023AE896A|nr:hypothetical protein [Erysipelothrix rhusiopathiae]